MTIFFDQQILFKLNHNFISLSGFSYGLNISNTATRIKLLIIVIDRNKFS